MITRLASIALLCAIVFPSNAQPEMFEAALVDFSTRKHWEYEDIPVNWQMEGKLQAELNEGVNSLFENEPAVAEASFTKVLEMDEKIWQAYYYRAACRKQQHEFGSALWDLKQAIKFHGDFYQAYIELAKVYFLLNQSADGEVAISKAIRLDKSKAIGYYIKGDLELKMANFNGAISTYKTCLKVDSLFHDARIKLALLRMGKKMDVNTGLPELNQVLKYDSLQKTALLFRGIFLFESDKSQSIHDLTSLISVSPNNVMAYYLRGVQFTAMKKYDEAFSDFQRVIKATSTSDNNFKGQQTWVDKKIDIQNVGTYTVSRVYGLDERDAARIKQSYCQIITGDYTDAIAALNEMPDPNSEPLSVYLKAVAYEHKGEHDMAYTYYNIALKLDNEIADAHKKRGIYLQEVKQWRHSITDLTEVIRLDPGSISTYRIRGISYYHNSQFDKALSDYNTYLAYDSTDKEVLGLRGMAYFKLGQNLNAYVDFARSGNFNAISFVDLDMLIDGILLKGDTTQALHYISAFTDSAPFFTEAYADKFRIDMAHGKWTDIERDIAHVMRNMRMDANPIDQSYLVTLQGMIYARYKHDKDAMKTFDEAIAMDKNNALAFRQRGKLWMGQGKNLKAEEDLKRAIALGDKEATQLLEGISK